MMRCLALLLVISGCHKQAPPHQSRTVEAIADYTDLVKVVGRLRSAQQAFISVKNGGSLDAIHVKQGERVEQNQILAVIDKETRTANLQRALSNFKLAKAEFRRVNRLFRNGSTTRSELDKAEAEQSVREAELKVAREELNDALVRSPIAGKVVYFAFALGDIVPDGSRLAVIENPDKLEMRAKVAFTDTAKVLNENRVELTRYDLRKRTPIGEAVSLGATITRLQQASDYDSSYTEIKIIFVEQSQYRPGELVELTLYRHQYDKLWSIPNEAVFSRQNKEWILSEDKNGSLSKTEVEIVARKGGYSLVADFPADHKLVLPKVGESWQAFLKHETVNKLF